MPDRLILAIIVIVIAIIALLVARALRRKSEQIESSDNDRDTRGYRDAYSRSLVTDKAAEYRTASRVTKWGALGAFVLAALLVLSSCFTTVSTKNVGVVTSFGKPVGSLTNGVHPKLPWTKTTELDGAIQTDSHAGNSSKDDTPCTSVRIAHQSVACVDNSIRWRIQPGAADRLFRDYKDFANIRDSLVTRELSAALNTVFKDYDPLATDDKGNSIAPSQDMLSANVTKLLKAQIGNDIDVKNVIVPIVHFDEQTQGRINALQAEVANTRIARQKQQTADAEATANKKLAGSVSHDPNVLVSKCFDTLAEMIKQHQQIPAGFSCWPGGGQAVVVPSTK